MEDLKEQVLNLISENEDFRALLDEVTQLLSGQLRAFVIRNVIVFHNFLWQTCEDISNPIMKDVSGNAIHCYPFLICKCFGWSDHAWHFSVQTCTDLLLSKKFGSLSAKTVIASEIARHMHEVVGWSGPLPKYEPLACEEVRIAWKVNTCKNDSTSGGNWAIGIRCHVSRVVSSSRYAGWQAEGFERSGDAVGSKRSFWCCRL